MERIYLAACGQYNPLAVESGVRAAMEGLGVAALPGHGETLLHVACPWAHPRFAPASHTHPAVIEGVARALSGSSIVLGGNSLPGFPTRYGFRNAGYPALARRLGARLAPFDEIGVGAVPGSDDQSILLPAPRWTPSFIVSLPKLAGSTHVPFAGALRHQFSRLPQAQQLADGHRMPERLVDLLPAARPDLIVVDAIQAMHKGGELSGEPVDLGMLIVGTNPIAVDLICAVAFGLEPGDVDFLQIAAQRGLRPTGLDEIFILGDLDLTEMRSRAKRVQRVDPNPENYPLPSQVKVIRSAKSRLAGTAGGLTETFSMLKRAGIGLDRARETTLVVGHVPRVPPGKSDYATLIFLDDTSRGEYAGYSRVVRLQGRSAPVSRLLQDVPFAMTVANVRAELGGEFVLAGIRASAARLAGRLAGRRARRAAVPPTGV